MSVPDETSGQRVGRYTIVRRLAVGGMAELYLARATGAAGFEKAVALKKIRPHLASEPRFIEMFLREARMAAALEHPNIVHVSDLGESEGDYFLAMEYLHGRDLSSILRRCNELRRWLPWRCALLIATGVAAGLHYAHEKLGSNGQPMGLVHRDISPSNIFITYDGAVKILDFGIARAAAQTSVTQEGTRKGKVPYMSPEQCQSSIVDRRSDLFSLGIVLYEMTTITRLFYGDNEFATMNRIVTKDVEPPSNRIEGYPDLLEKIVLKALQRDPAHRYQTGLEMQLELEHAAGELGLVGSPRELGAFVAEICGKDPPPSLELGPTRVTSASLAGASLGTQVQARQGPIVTHETSIDTHAVMPGPGRTATLGLRVAAVGAMLGLSAVGGYWLARGGGEASVPEPDLAAAVEDDGGLEPDPPSASPPGAPSDPASEAKTPVPDPPLVDAHPGPAADEPVDSGSAAPENPPDPDPDAPQEPSPEEPESEPARDPAGSTADPDAGATKPPRAGKGKPTSRPSTKSGKKPKHDPGSSATKSTTGSSTDPGNDELKPRGNGRPGSVGGKLEDLHDMK